MRLPRILLLTLLVAAIAGLTLTATARAAVAPASPAAPQTLRFDGGMATLDGPWQFHLGDDSAWARAGFDDSGWEQLDAGKPWGEQGHESVDGYAWYRRHVNLAPGEKEPEQLAILIPAVEDAYELYWNGQFGGRLRNAAAASGVVLRHVAAYLGTGVGAIGRAGNSRVEGAVSAPTTTASKADFTRRRCWAVPRPLGMR